MRSGTHPEDLARTRSSRYDVGVRCLRRREDEESGPGAELSDRAHREGSRVGREVRGTGSECKTGNE
jgi:hypothetical protein